MAKKTEYDTMETNDSSVDESTSNDGGDEAASSDQADTGEEGSVDISEVFQREVNALLEPATYAECEYLASKANKRCSELRDAERAAQGPTMDEEGMPS